jgi:CHASE3 domain sensor protein
MSIRLKIISSLTLIIPVIAVFLMLLQIAQKKNEEQRIKIAHSYQVVIQITTLLSDIQDAETRKRGYIITNDKSFLELYNRSIRKVDADLTQLSKLTQTNAGQQQRLNEFEPVLRNALDYMTETIAISEKQGLEAAAKRVASNTGKTLLDRLRTVLGNMTIEEQRSAMEQEKAYNRALTEFYKGNTIFIVSTSLITIIIGWLLIRSITWPLRELRIGAGKLGAGKYTTRLKFTYQDEFNELVIAFNQMAEAIQARGNPASCHCIRNGGLYRY